jgi:hypothetical protein
MVGQNSGDSEQLTHGQHGPAASSMAASRRRHEQSIAYDDFFAGFGFGSAAGYFATLDENFPSCGGFGLPRILILLFAIGYFLSRSHHTPEISSEFDNGRWLQGSACGFICDCAAERNMTNASRSRATRRFGTTYLPNTLSALASIFFLSAALSLP